MTREARVIFAASNGYRLGAPADDEAVLTPLDEIPAGEVLLALPSRLCLSTRMARSASDDPIRSAGRWRRRAWRHALLFDLEEVLPLAAEDITADFILADEEILSICVRTQDVLGFVEPLEQVGCAVDVICPAALLALQQVMSGEAAGDAQVVLIGEGADVNLFLVRDGQPRRWHLLPRNAQDVLARLALMRSADALAQLALSALGVDAALLAELEAAGWTVRNLAADDADDLERAALAAAGDILRGRRPPPINLRREALAPADPLRKVRLPLYAATASLALLLVALIGAWLIAAHRYDAAADSLKAQQVRLYRELMPGSSRIPPNVPRRLASEHRAMLSRTGAGEGLPAAGSALTLMRDTFERLPRDTPFQLDRVRLGDGGVELAGQVRSHQDAGRLAAALSADERLNVEPARTHALRTQGVGFTIVAALRQPAAARAPTTVGQRERTREGQP